MDSLKIIEADLNNTNHQHAVATMIDDYAADPMGNGAPLTDAVRKRLIPALREQAGTRIFLAIHQQEPVGIAVCFTGFSTFAAMPLINIHDLFVSPRMRGKGLGRMLLQRVEDEAAASACCKVTLEVLEHNRTALEAYRKFGFSSPTHTTVGGGTWFMSKSVGMPPQDNA